ncbi:MAG TPA: S-layer homology domain-containing protein [Symbiobacteriaceae bacterium]|nr:S-layer homology domain-containing protein [Symbiobacteriaceae bacterium]
MNLRRVTASAALTALLLGTTAMPALADKGGNGSDKGRAHKVSEKFEDMGDFEWGLGEVTKMSVKGIFQGRGQGIFAPGAKINHQEAAVAIVRLMDKEDAAKALSAAEVETLLKGVDDAAEIAVWAKPSVAMLVKTGALDKDAPFSPAADATRLDIAVLLVNALGYQAEAQEKMSEKLAFKDAHLIPADLVGYVKVAIDHQLITGYEDKTFRPQQAVKRIEMAVMMGRADRLVEKEKEDEVKGTVKSVDAAHGSFVLTVGDKDRTLTLAEEASIFIDSAEKALADLKAGMRVEAKLNGDGKVIYVEAKSAVSAPQETVVNGSVTQLVAATPSALALVSIDNAAYPLSPKAVMTLNGQAATFADLKVGDTVKATTKLGLVIKLEATRSTPVQTVSGTVVGVTPATTSALAKLTLAVASNGATTNSEYIVAANAVVKINGQTAQLAGLRVTDSAKLTFANNLVTLIEVDRQATTVHGTISQLTAATASAPAKVTVTFPSLTTPAASTEYTLAAGAAVKVNGQAAQFADLKVNDTVTLTLGAGLVDKVEVTRVQVVIEGSVVALMAPAAGQTVPAGTLGLVSIIYTDNAAMTTGTYAVTSSTQILVNARAAQYAGVQLGDAVKATFADDLLVKLEVTR